LSDNMRGLINVFTEMFGSSFLKNACLVFTHWPLDTASRKRRLKSEQTEEKRASEFNLLFRNTFDYQGPPIDCFFLDCLDILDSEELAIYQTALRDIKMLALSKDPFECVDVKAVMDMKTEALSRAQDLEEKLQLAAVEAVDAATEAEARRLVDLEMAETQAQATLKAITEQAEQHRKQDLEAAEIRRKTELEEAETRRKEEDQIAKRKESLIAEENRVLATKLREVEAARIQAETRRVEAEAARVQAEAAQRAYSAPTYAYYGSPSYSSGGSGNSSGSGSYSNPGGGSNSAGAGSSSSSGLSWNACQHSMGGQGYSRAQMQSAYYAQKR